MGVPAFDSRDQPISTAGKSAQAVAVINAWYLREQRKAELRSATQAKNQALGAQEAACDQFSLLESVFNDTIGFESFVRRNSAVGNEPADSYNVFWQGVEVTLDPTYHQGRLVATTIDPNDSNRETSFYEVERWGIILVHVLRQRLQSPPHRQHLRQPKAILPAQKQLCLPPLQHFPPTTH